MIRITILILIISLNTSCVTDMLGVPKSWNFGGGGRLWLARGLPRGDDDYSRGFRDGCKSHLNAIGQGFLKNLKPEYDGWKLTTNALYSAGFKDGEEHCTYLLDWSVT